MTLLALSSSPAGRIKWSASYSRYLHFLNKSCILCIHWNLFIPTQSAFNIQDISILKRLWCCSCKAFCICWTLSNVWTTVLINISFHCRNWWHFKFRSKHYLQILISTLLAYNRPHLLNLFQKQMPKLILHYL